MQKKRLNKRTKRSINLFAYAKEKQITQERIIEKMLHLDLTVRLNVVASEKSHGNDKLPSN